MYTVEDINKAKQYLSDNRYGTRSIFTLNTVAILMAEWAAMAEWEVKNCAIPNVIKSVCDKCDYEVISVGRFKCKKCGYEYSR